MKLIDANELVKAIENENPGLSISGAIEKFARIAQVNMQPTVEAIPVKWLRQWFAENGFKFYDDNDNIYLVADIEEMFLEWEKENENRVE